MEEPRFKKIDPNHRHGPIRHDSLPKDVLDRIGTVYGLIGPYLQTNLEQFEIGFMRDAFPKAEAATWCCIAAAWQDYHQRFTKGKPLVDAEEGKLLAALVSISMGASDPAGLSVNPEMGGRLVACFRDATKQSLN